MKEWLIRTKSNHILGPVSKEKLRDLISNNSIKGDDEICCGNGFWIFVREKELITKYIFGEDKQGFNPVQEAEYVELDDFPPVSIDAQLPQDQDLEYPTTDVNIPDGKKEEVKSSIVIKKKSAEKDTVKASGTKRNQNKPEKLTKSKQRFYISPWVLIALIFIILIVVSTIFKENIMKQMISHIYSNLNATVHAQTLASPKKKSGLIIQN